MTAHDAQPSDAVKLLLDCFERLKGSKATPDDYLEATRLVGLPLAPEAMTSRMEAIRLRNGPQWKPSSMRYFNHPIHDLLQEPTPTPAPPRPAEQPPLSQEDHEQSLSHLRDLETPQQRQRVELVGTLSPRATFPELMRLLHERIDDAEFSRRLERARQRRRQSLPRTG